METYNVISNNEYLKKMLKKENKLFKLLNPKDNEEYESLKKEIEESIGKDELKKFNKEIMKELKEKGII